MDHPGYKSIKMCVPEQDFFKLRMDHSGYKQNRVALVCPWCFKVDKTLTTHLRRTCMRFSSLEEIHEVAHTARRRLWDIAEKATVFDHREIQKLTSPAEFSAFLERKGFFIVNKPRETAEPIATPSTSAAASAPDRVELAPETGATHRLSCLRSEPMEDTTMLRETAEPIARPSTSAAASAPDRVELAPETGATHRLSCLRSEPMEDTTMLRETAEPIARPSTSAAASAPDREEQAPETGATHPLSGPVLLRSEPMEDTTMLSFVTLEVVPLDLAIENCELEFPSGTDLSHAVPAASVSEEEQGAAENIEITEHEHIDIDNPEEDQGLERAAKMNWTSEIRLKMKEAGLYNRHPSSAPLLKAFTDFLTRTLGVTRYKQEVENVARFLYFMNPQDANLAFVKDIQRTNEFFLKLQEIVSHQTVFTYLKHVRRFVKFQIDNTNLFATDLSMHNACNNFMKATDALQKRISKGISREVVKKRYDSLTHKMKTPEDCRRLLSTAKVTFLKALDAAQKDETDDQVKFEIVHYLEALLVLKHLQRPGVVQNMTNTEWKNRIHHRYTSGNTQIRLTIIGVAEHKTATQQVAAFALTEEEEKWFDVYYRHIRPRLVRDNSPTDIFFLSSNGKKLHSVSNDLWRYHQRYNIPNVCSQDVRRVCETFTVSQYTDSERHLFAKYLAHTNATAERNYREKTLDDICHAYLLVSGAGASSSHESQAGTSRSVEAPTAVEKPPTPSFESGRKPVENQQEVQSRPCTPPPPLEDESDNEDPEYHQQEDESRPYTPPPPLEDESDNEDPEYHQQEDESEETSTSSQTRSDPEDYQQEVDSDEPCTSRLRRCTEAFEIEAVTKEPVTPHSKEPVTPHSKEPVTPHSRCKRRRETDQEEDATEEPQMSKPQTRRRPETYQQEDTSDEPCTSSGTEWDPEDHQQEVESEEMCASSQPESDPEDYQQKVETKKPSTPHSRSKRRRETDQEEDATEEPQVFQRQTRRSPETHQQKEALQEISKDSSEEMEATESMEQYSDVTFKRYVHLLIYY
ncbi:uncharacterized protein LOC108705534 isoform X2 [Xenopus laevis]|uniref:Uncharacterized protein LOC108705534 isoform X2 n=1 Tax=Xenopus laevis TaxID=8355 RepID=A0A8J1KNQ1_XENLA|nr:uncharacterized protein LOC108705534 isoform X2 [Xenopus laevis]